MRCWGSCRYAIRCKRFGKADTAGEYWCHDHKRQRGALSKALRSLGYGQS